MHPKSSAATAATDLHHFFETPANYAHANNVAGLVLERYGEGYAWFKPSAEPAEDDDALFTITDAGRRALRMAELFGTES